jgi:hypothetical protein
MALTDAPRCLRARCGCGRSDHRRDDLRHAAAALGLGEGAEQQAPMEGRSSAE